MEYKKHYTDEELAPLTQWFKEHWDSLPQDLRLNASTYFPDLRKTVAYYLDIVEMHRNNTTYAPQIFHLFCIKDLLTTQK